MKLFPAIDLRGGRAVRLFQGDYDKMTVYSDAPESVALEFKRAGARNLHLVDLDGAKEGDTPNFEVISRIVKESGLFVEVGGGVRSMETVSRYLETGVARVIIGTAAVTEPAFLRDALSKYGERIAVGVDIKGEAVATHGWTQTSGKNCFEFCAELEKLGVKTVICTDISRDGAMRGPNTELYRRLADSFAMEIIASGGVSAARDLASLSETGVAGAILGKALYTGAINLKDAIGMIEGANGP